MRCVLAMLLLSCPACVIGGDSFEGFDRNVQYTSFDSSEPYQGEQVIEANLQLHVGQLTLEAGAPDQAYELDLSYNDEAFEPKVSYRRSEKRGQLDFELEGAGAVRLHSGKTRLNVRLNPDTNLEIHVKTGVGQNVIDFSGLKLQELDLEAGVGETQLSMLSPNSIVCRSMAIENGVGALEVTGLGNFRCQQLEFRGGIGAAIIDFSGDWENPGQVEIKVGIGGVEIKLPRDLGVELKVRKSFLSGVDLKGFRKTDGGYLSENFDQASKKMQLSISAGIGGIEIDWI